MGIVAWIVVGAIAGILAGFFVTGDEGLGIIGRVLLGIVGAVVGGFVAGLLLPGSRLPHRDQHYHDHRRHDRRGHRRGRLQLLYQQEWIGTRGGLTLPHRDAGSARGPLARALILSGLVARSGHAFTSLSPVNRHARRRRIGGAQASVVIIVFIAAANAYGAAAELEAPVHRPDLGRHRGAAGRGARRDDVAGAHLARPPAPRDHPTLRRDPGGLTARLSCRAWNCPPGRPSSSCSTRA